MKMSTAAGAARRFHTPRLAPLLVCLAATLLLGCDGSGTRDAATGQAASSSSEDQGNEDAVSRKDAVTGQAASSSSEDRGHEATVSRENPGLQGRSFDGSRNDALFDAPAIDAVRWTMPPVISPGAIEAEGVLQQGATLFSPMNGEPAAFAVYYKGMREALVVLLPDLAPGHVWETTLTVAPMEHELEGASFKFRAYSPLFMDVGPSDLDLRVFGYDGAGNEAVLAVQSVNAP